MGTEDARAAMGSRTQWSCAGPDQSDCSGLAHDPKVAASFPTGMGVPPLWNRAQPGYAILLLLDPHLVHNDNQH